MSRIEAIGRFLCAFVIGDDWTIAVGVATGLAITGALAHAGHAAYAVLPLLVIMLLGWSVRRAAR